MRCTPETVAFQQQAMARTLAQIVQIAVERVSRGEALNLSTLRQKCAAQNACARPPKLVECVAAIPEQYKKILGPHFRAKPIRSASGIAVVAVMSKPHRCPHIAMTGGVCVYCPGGPDSDFEYSTQSYTGYEPVRRDFFFFYYLFYYFLILYIYFYFLLALL